MSFDPEKFIPEAVEYVKKTVGTGSAIIAVSGGVDSTTCAVIAHRALDESLRCVFVDTGLLRKGEQQKMKRAFSKLGIPVKAVDAKTRFFEKLKGVEHPEDKRKIIGELFIRIFEEDARESKAEFLVQGTIAPDWIESGEGIRDRIKTHHNVGGVPEDIGLKLVEPVRDLYKDEVRKVAKRLGIPEETYTRQPFPGPALAVRVIGEVTPEKIEIEREACAIVEEEIDKAFEEGLLKEKPWQYFAVLLPTKSVGVHGDLRAYGYTVAVRSVQSLDAMTATYSKIPQNVLHRISLRITNTMKDTVNRVVYDITDKPPATIEWE